MLAILSSLNAHTFPIFRPILMILVSKVMVHKALSDKAYLSLGLLSPLNKTAFPIAQTDFFDRKNAFYDHDFTTEVIVLDNQSVRDRRLIGRAVIIITERTGFS